MASSESGQGQTPAVGGCISTLMTLFPIGVGAPSLYRTYGCEDSVYRSNNSSGDLNTSFKNCTVGEFDNRTPVARTMLPNTRGTDRLDSGGTGGPEPPTARRRLS